jgi:hypothetical protein
MNNNLILWITSLRLEIQKKSCGMKDIVNFVKLI